MTKRQFSGHTLQGDINKNSMASEYNHARYVLNQGNVTSFNLNDLSLNLLGFDKDRSVLEYTEGKKKDQQQEGANDDTVKKTVGESQGIIAKPIIIKSIPSTGGLILINDKNIKIPVKKCTNVPQNILKIFGDKKGKQQTTSVSNSTLTKGIRTYEKKRDKAPYQCVEADNQNPSVNKSNAFSSVIKDTSDDACGADSDNNRPINPVGIVKINEEKFVDQIKHRISVENINKLLNGAAKKNVIVLKCPTERRNTIDNGEIGKVANVQEKLRVKDVNTLNRTFSIDDRKESDDKIIDLTVKEEQPDEYEESNTNNSLESESGKNSDGILKFKIKHVIVNQQQDLEQKDADMGKIKHFKERTDSIVTSKANTVEEKLRDAFVVDTGGVSRLHGKPPDTVERGNRLFYDDFNDANLIQRYLETCRSADTVNRDCNGSEDTMRGCDMFGERLKCDSMTQQRLKKRQRAKNLFLRQEMIERCVKAISQKKKKTNRRASAMSRKPANSLKDSACQTESLPLNTASTQTDSCQEHSFDDLDDLRSIIGSDVNLGDGPRMPVIRSGVNDVTYNLGSTLDSFVGNQNVAPTQLVANMGYLSAESVPVGVLGGRAHEKRAFYEYLRTCHVPDSAGNLPLHLGVMNNDLAEVKKQILMLGLWKLSIDCTNGNHLTPLHLAVIHNCDEPIVNHLLDSGADISCMDSEGNNPIHLAVFHNSAGLLRVLLQRATDISFNLNAFNHEGFTPLLLATIEDKYEMVRTFLEFGTDANVRDQKSGRTPLFHAVENNNLKMVKLLLDNDANKKIKNFSGTSTHDAVFELENISPHIKNIIIGKELFTINSTRTDKRKKPVEKPKEVCTKKLKTVKTFRKIKIKS